LKGRWNDYALALTAYVTISGEYPIEDDSNSQKKRLRDSLEHISKYFSNSGRGDWSHIVTGMMTYNNDLYIKVGAEFMLKGDDIRNDVMKASIKIF
jgi:hypothetical protein